MFLCCFRCADLNGMCVRITSATSIDESLRFNGYISQKIKIVRSTIGPLVVGLGCIRYINVEPSIYPLTISLDINSPCNVLYVPAIDIEHWTGDI